MRLLVITLAVLAPVSLLAEDERPLGELLDQVFSTNNRGVITEVDRANKMEAKNEIMTRSIAEFEEEVVKLEDSEIQEVVALASIVAQMNFNKELFSKLCISDEDRKKLLAIATYIDSEELQKDKEVSSVAAFTAEELAANDDRQMSFVATLAWLVSLDASGESCSPALEKAQELIEDLGADQDPAEFDQFYGLVLNSMIESDQYKGSGPASDVAEAGE